MFSTSEAVLESLPNDATVLLKIVNEDTLDYTLKFSKKTMGLDSLTAKCKYTFDVSAMHMSTVTAVVIVVAYTRVESGISTVFSYFSLKCSFSSSVGTSAAWPVEL